MATVCCGEVVRHLSLEVDARGDLDELEALRGESKDAPLRDVVDQLVDINTTNNIMLPFQEIKS